MRVFPEQTPDEEFVSLGDLGHTGSLQDRRYQYLRGEGFTGGLNDMLYQQGLLGLIGDPSTIITSTDQFAWWQAGTTQAYSDLGTTPVDTDGSSVRSYEPGAGSLSNFNRTTASGQEPTLQTRDGIRVVRFDGVNDYLDRSLGWDGDKTVMIVGYNESGQQHRLMSSTSGSSTSRQHLVLQPDNSLTIYAQSGGPPTAIAPEIPAGWFCMIVEFAGPRTTISLNGYHKTFTTSPGDNTLAGGFRTALNNNGSGYTQQDEVAAVLVNGLLTADEHRQLMDWGCRIAGISLPSAARSTDNYSIDITRVRTVTAYEVGFGEVAVPSYEPSVVDVRNDPEFDGVVDANGDRLNYLIYSSRDHTSSGAGFGDGIYLSCLFGHPLTGSVLRYDQARAAGYLNSFPGYPATVPAATNGMIFLTGFENETADVIKVGSTWNLLSQIQQANGGTDQATVQALSSSPFGPFTLQGTAGVDEMYLDPDDLTPNGNHTGYARILETPIQSTITQPYVIRSLLEGGGSGRYAIWGTDANMSRASVTALASGVQWYAPGVTAPLDGVSPGAPVRFAPNGYRGPLRYNGTDFTTLTEGVTDGSGIDPRAAMVYEARIETDLVDYRQTFTPQLLLTAGDFAPFFPHGLNGLNLPQIVEAPDGSKVLFVYGQGTVARQDYLFVMPVTETA